MIEHGSVRNEKQREELINMIKERRLPFKIIIQDIYPGRTIEQNAYYWFIITIIAKVIGEDIIKVHNDYRLKFLFGYWPDNEGNWELRVRSTTELDTVEMADYTEMVRIDALVIHGINTPNPDEVIINDEKQPLAFK